MLLLPPLLLVRFQSLPSRLCRNLRPRWLLLLPLALTSNRAMMRRLKTNWQRLHRLVYAIAVLAVLHFWWLVKSDIREPLLYALVLTLLLAARIFKQWKVQRTAV